MKIICLLILLLLGGGAFAEENIEIDMSSIYNFAQQYDAEEQVRCIYESTLQGDINSQTLLEWAEEWIQEPFEDVLGMCARIFPAILMSALIGSMLPDDGGGGGALQFFLRLSLLLGFTEMATSALLSIEKCVAASKMLVDRIAPLLTTMLAAIGVDHSLALLSPMAVLVGNLAEQVFLKYGLPLCRCALCIAVSGSLCKQIQMKRFNRLCRRVVNWGTGIVVTVFTAFLTLQTNMSGNLDGVAARTAKYTVDSASSVIGSGISDAWEAYAYGVMATKNAVGVSGMTALLFAVARPVLTSLCVMAALNLCAALLDTFGEKCSADAAEQIGDICQMALSISTATLAITMILLGAVIKMGQGVVA